MKKRFIPLFIWSLYTLILVLVSARVQLITFIIFGSGLGFCLPRLFMISAYLLSPKDTKIDFKLARRMLLLFWSGNESVFSTGSLGNLLHSYPFLFAFGACAIFVLVSSPHWFGRALVLGFGLHLILDLWKSQYQDHNLKQRWFSTYYVRLVDAELEIFVWVCVLVFIAMTIFSLKG